MIANCGAMGVDWQTLSLSGYIEALVAHNNTADPAGHGGTAEPTEELRGFWKAHTIQ